MAQPLLIRTPLLTIALPAPPAATQPASALALLLQYENQTPMAGAEVEIVRTTGRTRHTADAAGRIPLDTPVAPDEVMRIFLLSFPQSFQLPEPPPNPDIPKPPAPPDLRPHTLCRFAFDSSFPPPALLSRLEALVRAADLAAHGGATVRIRLFGHTDSAGSDAYNLSLSERRVNVVLALLANDHTLLDAVAAQEGWNLAIYQAMLRGLGCNPGPIDGNDGPMLQEAVRAFQEEYNRDVFHVRAAARTLPDVSEDGQLGANTKAALRDAYCAAAPHLPSDRLAEPRAAGCGEAHPVSTVDFENRRTVAVFVDASEALNPDPCANYAAVGENAADLRGPAFHDFAWLRGTGDLVHLSALTHLADDSPCHFTVLRSNGPAPVPPPDSTTAAEKPAVGPVLATLDGTIKRGVAFARWSPGAGEDPFNPTNWLVDHTARLEIEGVDDNELPAADDPASPNALLAADAFHPPLFLVESGDHWTLSTPPGQRLDRVFFEEAADTDAMLLRSDGALLGFALTAGRLTPDTPAGNTPVFSLALAERAVEFAEVAFAPQTATTAPGAPLLNPAIWETFLRTATSPRAPVRLGNAVRFLIDGAITYRAMVEAMRAAQKDTDYIYLLGWSLVDNFRLIPGDNDSSMTRPDTTPGGGPAVPTPLLVAAAARGVQIRAMLWDQLGTTNTDEVDRINRLATGAAILDNETLIAGAHHQKVLVVKAGETLVAFCGGLDIHNDRLLPLNTAHGDPQHDVHCRIEGPAAHDLLLTFIGRWDHHPGSAALDRSRGALLGRTTPPPGAIASPGSATASTGRPCGVVIARTFNPVTRGTTAVRERDIQTLLTMAIAQAQRFIYMEDQYLIHPLAATLLNRAVRRLDHLTILTTASEILAGSGELGSGGLPCVWRLRLNFVNLLMAGLSAANRAKVRIFVLVRPPITTPPTFGLHTYVHAKTWVFDDELAVIGSANCNRRGWSHDSELNAFIFDQGTPPVPTFAQGLRMALWAEHLNTTPAAVTDGVASAALWLTPPAGAKIMRYDPTASTDTLSALSCAIAVPTLIDPSGP